jgi:hypothetical protein
VSQNERKGSLFYLYREIPERLERIRYWGKGGASDMIKELVPVGGKRIQRKSVGG